jgi:gamma-glutamyl phosphate reductase
VTCIYAHQKSVIGLVESREDVAGMLKLDGAIDLIIPRGPSSATPAQRTQCTYVRSARNAGADAIYEMYEMRSHAL